MLSKRKRAVESSAGGDNKRKKKERTNSLSNDDDKEFLFLDQHVENIFEDDCGLHNNIKEEKLPPKRGKVEMSSRVVGLTEMQRSRTAHFLIPAFNAAILPTKSFKDLQKYPSYDITAPSAIYVAKAACAAIDICYQRTRSYDHYKNLLTGGRTRYLNQLKKNKRLESMERDNVYSSHVFTFAERFNADPDPYFYGTYDYYYTGGNLCILPTSNYLLHANGEKLENLVVSKYEQSTLPQYTEFVHTQSFSAENSEIFEMRAFPASLTNQQHFSVRQRTEFTLISLNANEDDTEVLYSFKAKVPFISSTHIPNYKKHLLTSNMCQQMRLYDLDEAEARIIKQYNMNSLKNVQNHSWNMLRPYDEHTIIYANEQQIFLIDPRTSPEEWLHTSCHATHAAYGCEKISCLAVSNFKPFVYVANTHHLHALDLRKFESDLSEKSALFTCTHQMRYPAAFMDTFYQNNIEYIAMSSAVAGEVRLCELGSKEMEISSTSLAYQPPSLKEAYQHAKLSGRCLQAAADLRKRVELCTTGLVFCQQSAFDSGQLLIANSIGDVFAHSLLEKQQPDSLSARVNAESDAAMQSYAERICNNINIELQYTDVCQMTGIKKVFRCRDLSDGCVLSDEFEQRKHSRRLGRWQKSFAALKNFKDALAQDLLSIWDIENEQDRSLNVTLPEESKHDISTDVKVNNWLNMGTIIAPPMISICGPLESTQIEPCSGKLLNNTILTDNTPVTFEFVNTSEELQLFSETQATLLPLGQIISTEQLETLTQQEGAERKVTLSQIFSRRNSGEDITSIPASSELKEETVKVVHVEVPPSTDSVTDSNRHEKLARRPPTPARLSSSVKKENVEMEDQSHSDKQSILSIKKERNNSSSDKESNEKEKENTTSQKKKHRNSVSDQSVVSSLTKINWRKLENISQPTACSDVQSTTSSLNKEKHNGQRPERTSLHQKELKDKHCDNQSMNSALTLLTNSLSDKASVSELTNKNKNKNRNSFSSSFSKSPNSIIHHQSVSDKKKFNEAKKLKKKKTISLLPSFEKSPINISDNQSKEENTAIKQKKKKKISLLSSLSKSPLNIIHHQSIEGNSVLDNESLSGKKKKKKRTISSSSNLSKSPMNLIHHHSKEGNSAFDNEQLSGITKRKKEHKISLSSSLEKSALIVNHQQKKLGNSVPDNESLSKITQNKKKRKNSLSSSLSKSLTNVIQHQSKKANSVSDKESLNETTKKKEKQIVSFLPSLEKSAMKINHHQIKEGSGSDKESLNDIKKKKKRTISLSSLTKSPNKSLDNSNEDLHQIKTKAELISTLNSTLNATDLHKTKKSTKTKPKFKKYVKGF